ncbi:hypothetical protein AB6A40_004429 [Gnathostoma spinigerum]|uniref:Dipeptidylpeptidase IV N-terminal domain-containing protein n=1 Tax=Gnathostoma spinigerum TaxID=75299 RepID=A0ABD6ECH0_9BILA
MAPCAEPFDVVEKSWSDILNHARHWRNVSRKGLGETLHHFCLYEDNCGADHLLALGSNSQSSPQTIYSAVLPRSSQNVATSNLTLSPHLQPVISKGPLPAELAALCERQRTTASSGISAYEYQSSSGSLLYSDTAHLYMLKNEKTHQIGDSVSGFPLNASICPVDSDIVAFVVKSNVHIDKKGRIIYSTNSSSNIMNGCASFITQEEFDRFTGLWWSPGPKRQLLYERVDESAVTRLQFTCPGKVAGTPMRYPLAGTANAVSTLRLIDLESSEARDHGLNVDLKSIYPWYEYLSRVGWLRNGEGIWAILLDRLQVTFALIVIPVDLFNEKNGCEAPKVITLLQDQTSVWFNVDNITHFFPVVNNNYRFLYASNKNDQSHIFLCSVTIAEDSTVTARDEKAITYGDWSVLGAAGSYVDEKREHLYFLSNKHHPADSNLFVVSLTKNGSIRMLSTQGLSYRCERKENSLDLNPDVGFVCWESSLEVPPRCVFYRLTHSADDILPSAHIQHVIQLPGTCIANEDFILSPIGCVLIKLPKHGCYFEANIKP